MTEPLLAFNTCRPDSPVCRLRLDLLYPSGIGRDGFERRWPDFLASDPMHPLVFRREGYDVLWYDTESLVPVERDGRPPLLMLFGNPAPHSVVSGMFFAFEGGKREHRLWIGLRKAGLLAFQSDDGASRQEPDNEKNQRRKRDLLGLNYRSPFRIGLTVYFTASSTASVGPWAGVAGLQRLFGRRALRMIAQAEQQRLEGSIREFMPSGGTVLSFQRDAYEGVRTDDSPPYSLERARAGHLRGTCKYGHGVRLVGVAPTRYMHSARTHEQLASLPDELTRD